MNLNLLRTGTVDDFANQLFVPPPEVQANIPAPATSQRWLWIALGVLTLFLLIAFYQLNSKLNSLTCGRPATDGVENLRQDIQDLQSNVNHTMNSVKNQLHTLSERSERAPLSETRKFSDNIEHLLSASTAPLVSARPQTSLR